MGFFEIFRPDIAALAAQKDYAGLVKALQYNDPAIQKEAGDALEKAGAACVPALLAAISSTEKNEGNLILPVLFRIDPLPLDQLDRVMPVLKQQYDEDPESIIRIFSGTSSNGIRFLGKMLDSPEKKAQDLAIRVLKYLGEPVWPALTEALVAHSHMLRYNAAKALVEGGWKPRTEEEYIRFKAAQGDWKELAKMKKAAVPALVALLSDNYYGIRRDAAATLGKIGDPRAVVPLCAMLADPDPEICVSAAEALRNIPDKRAIPPLVKALQHPAHTVCFTAAHTLAAYEWIPTRDTEKILYHLGLEQWKELSSMGKSAIPALVLALGDGYYSVRQGAAETLMQMGGAGREALTQALKNDNPTIRQTAMEFLGRAGRRSGNQARPVEIEKSPVERMDPKAGHGRAVTPAGTRTAPPVFPDRKQGAGPEPVHEPARVAPDPVRPAPEPKTSPGPMAERVPDAPRTIAPDTPGKTILEVPDPKAKKPEAASKRDLSALIAALHNADEDIRMVAVENLLKCGDDAVDPLLSVLSDPSARVRSAAAEALGKLHCDRAVSGLAALLSDTDEEVRCAAAAALGVIGDIQAFAPLARLLTDDYEKVRRAAVSGLAGLGGQAVPYLIKLLGHEKPRIRAGAATALGATGTPGACAPLAALFTDTDQEVRESAARAVGSIGIPAMKILENAVSSADPAVRLCGVTGLGIIGEPAKELLVRACQDPDPRVAEKARQLAGPGQAYANHQESEPENQTDVPAQGPADLIRLINSPNKDVVIKAVSDLVQAGEDSVLPLVDALLHEKEEIRAGAAEALVAIGEPSVHPLLQILQTSPADEKIWILHTLGKLGDRRAVEPISDLLFVPDSRLQQAAMEALGYIGDARVTGKIAELLHDPDERTREVAARVLGYIGDPSSSRLLIPALGDEEYTVREIAEDALFEIGEPAIPALVDALKNPSHDIREGAAAGLSRQNWEPATTDEKVYFLMAQENWIDLARMGTDAITPLTYALDNADEELHMGVILTLGRMARPETVSLLARALVDKNVMIRQKAMRALVDMGESAREPLKEFASTSPSDLRQATEDVLARIDRKVHS